ncbi:MAG: rhodanese-like domain-containing protein [Verrucomicrobiales bacterium]|nr:rhodanese-like domain-containing protein [Verrucomicrobiales bacterium]
MCWPEPLTPADGRGRSGRSPVRRAPFQPLPRGWRNGLAALLAAGLLDGCRPEAPKPPPDWAALKQEIRTRHPEVPVVSTAELAVWLERGPGGTPLLLDVRAPAEYAVSHLPGAVNAADVPAARAAIAAAGGTRRVVLYCSVGYRSAALAVQLIERGCTNVFNLEGSVFQWANEGRPLRRGNEEATVVHPFDADWGRLLNRERWSTPSP